MATTISWKSRRGRCGGAASVPLRDRLLVLRPRPRIRGWEPDGRARRKQRDEHQRARSLDGPRLAPLCLLAAFLCHGGLPGGETRADAPRVDFAARAQRLFIESQERLRAQPTNAEAAWQFARAAFDLAEFATNDTQRAALADEAIAVARRLIEREPRLAAAHYYLALNLGQLARTKSLGALKLVQEMEQRFKTARELDEHFDFAGPDRSLGLLYLDAPGWPASIGSRAKARLHLERAVELAPDFPENRLCLLEALLKWRDKKAAQRQAVNLSEVLQRARTNLTGAAWAGAWADWERRWEDAQRKLKAKPPACP